MEVAALVLGSLGTLGLLLTIYQLQRAFRFRQPVFAVDLAEFVAEEGSTHVTVGPGKIVIDARGANRPIAITEWGITIIRGSTKGPGGGYGSSGSVIDAKQRSEVLRLPYLIELPVEQWIRFQLEPGRFSLTKADAEGLEVELHLRSPEETFVLLPPLQLKHDGTKYSWEDDKRRRRHIRRTTWRHRGGLADRLRRFLS